MTSRTRRHGPLLAAGAIVALVLTGTVLAASPRPSTTADPDASKPPKSQPNKTDEQGEKADKPSKREKADKGPELSVTLTGTVATSKDDKGRSVFTITDGSTAWELSAGPKWYWGDANPLKAHVGKRITVVGTHHEGDTDLDVETIDGKVIREPGRPPWAGGPRAQGENHPGWKAWRTWQTDGPAGTGRGHGRDGAPGQIDKATPSPSS